MRPKNFQNSLACYKRLLHTKNVASSREALKRERQKMQTLDFICHVDYTPGTFGFSALVNFLGRTERQTVWFVRDERGDFVQAVIVNGGSR